MSNKVIPYIIIVAVLLGCFVLHFFTSTQQQEPSNTRFTDEPTAHTLYDKMIETMRKADTLFYESDFRGEADGEESGHCTYTIWMKKPNYFRVEVISSKGEKGGTLIGDGNDLWIYWPGDRPYFWWEDVNHYEKTHSNVYMKKATPIGRHSIAHKTGLLGAGLDMPIIDPSTFHGYTDTLQSHLDSVRSIGTEKVSGQECEVIEVSIMKGQRKQYLWLSKQDNLPRKLKEIVHVDYDIITDELWSNVTIDAEIPTEKFVWSPPTGWKQWQLPSPKDKLLKPGQEAPDFEFLSINGSKIKLSDFRGKVVWLNIWRVGCPPCRKEMPYLEQLYSKFKDKGFVVLGFNCSDDKKIAMDFLHEHSVTFPNILDSSGAATKTTSDDYKTRGVPVNFIIDREGKIAAAWYGYDPNDTRGVQTLEKLGVK